MVKLSFKAMDPNDKLGPNSRPEWRLRTRYIDIPAKATQQETLERAIAEMVEYRRCKREFVHPHFMSITNYEQCTACRGTGVLTDSNGIHADDPCDQCHEGNTIG